MKQLIIDQSPILNIAMTVDLNHQKIEKVIMENQFSDNILGNIYLGRVVQFAESIDGVFIDIGQRENGFLSRREYLKTRSREEKGLPLTKLLKKGELILVQVIKESYQLKGPQLTADISLAGKYVVLLPQMKGIRFSKKLRSHVNKDHISKLIDDAYDGELGWIVRSVVNEVQSEEMISKDINRLCNQWTELVKISKLSSKTAALYDGSNFFENIYRKLYDDSVERVCYHSKALKSVLMEMGIPAAKLKLIAPQNAIYHEFGVDLERYLFESIVDCGEGINATIDELEAFTIVDVNSGSYTAVDKVKMTDEVNRKAALSVKNHLLNRNISGVIIIDFIDMKKENASNFMKFLEEEVFTGEDDFLVCGLTTLGLVELTRKRERPSSLDAVSFNFRQKDRFFWHLNELYYELLKIEKHTNTKELTVELEEALYIFLAQRDIFNGFEYKIRYVKKPTGNGKYRFIRN